jgi:putative transposase
LTRKHNTVAHILVAESSPKPEGIALPQSSTAAVRGNRAVARVTGFTFPIKGFRVKAWLARHPRYHLHFTPTSASWLNQVERWFALLTDKQIKRGVHRSVDRLKADIAAFIQAHNDHPKPFIWTKTADTILQTIARYCSDTLAIHTAIS